VYYLNHVLYLMVLSSLVHYFQQLIDPVKVKVIQLLLLVLHYNAMKHQTIMIVMNYVISLKKVVLLMDMVVLVMFPVKIFKLNKPVKVRNNVYIVEIVHNYQLNVVFFNLNQYV